MAAHGGGAWKVAYADFVTAMMAFFLVMWICAQDQKIKESVAHYFTDPWGDSTAGKTKKPTESGAFMDSAQAGAIPKQRGVSEGKGRNFPSTAEEVFSATTRDVIEWILADATASKYWKEQVEVQRKAAMRSKEVTDEKKEVDEVTKDLLARQLRREFTEKFAALPDELNRSIMLNSVPFVNWDQIAEDLIRN